MEGRAGGEALAEQLSEHRVLASVGRRCDAQLGHHICGGLVLAFSLLLLRLRAGLFPLPLSCFVRGGAERAENLVPSCPRAAVVRVALVELEDRLDVLRRVVQHLLHPRGAFAALRAAPPGQHTDDTHVEVAERLVERRIEQRAQLAAGGRQGGPGGHEDRLDLRKGVGVLLQERQQGPKGGVHGPLRHQEGALGLRGAPDDELQGGNGQPAAALVEHLQLGGRVGLPGQAHLGPRSGVELGQVPQVHALQPGARGGEGQQGRALCSAGGAGLEDAVPNRHEVDRGLGVVGRLDVDLLQALVLLLCGRHGLQGIEGGADDLQCPRAENTHTPINDPVSNAML